MHFKLKQSNTKGPTTYKRELQKKETFKTERNRAVGTTEPLQNTETETWIIWWWRFTVQCIHLFAGASLRGIRVQDLQIEIRLTQEWCYIDNMIIWTIRIQWSVFKSLAAVKYLSSKPLCVYMNRHQEPNLFCNIWFEVVWNANDMKQVKHLIAVGVNITVNMY